ncbi:proliferating cell nuclear antigen (pcna) [Candidatus Bathyarchaeota archaeon]|nr:proliferating cell nuclear antigen (pcna) [Candidatus Bathyarchaeota archaeon]NIU81112.1 proliferating cell nuclear antigen (pcna) [Candidatus Bathyarchaeota archaeon]NIV68128.1 proliferating cell nuclear antigen (pcna) [Candidatus Bathyarchaeota archaeon]NIW16224.1 proliferating cell nuclear antigen (pcna) [Candidatus Bathyarchaeota archaeon]NIW34345.1 proliferating cell nuclear antigen (pcna) [Candidatus Bathyarchaeota archaeon]
MFVVKAVDSKRLKDIFTAVSTVVDEATFHVGSQGIELRAMDPARVAMIDLFLPSTAFDQYRTSEDMELCLNTNQLLKLVKRARSTDSVELSLDEEKGQLNVTIQGEYRRSFHMPVLEPQEEEAPPPQIVFQVKAALTTSGLRRILRDADLAADHVQLQADGESLMMHSKGVLMEAKIDLQKDSEALLSLKVEEPSQATFSLNYLTSIVKAARSTSDIVTIEFSKDTPIRLDFKQPQDGRLRYYLAPRVETTQ